MEFRHPRCVEETWLDYEEGMELWAAGEVEDARDVFRFALEGCGDQAWVHVALGRLALEQDRDMALARGHFGYVIELARRGLGRAPVGRLDPQLLGNQPVFEAMAGLIRIMRATGQQREAEELQVLGQKWSGEAGWNEAISREARGHGEGGL
jgi:hypothetical protein